MNNGTAKNATTALTPAAVAAAPSWWQMLGMGDVPLEDMALGLRYLDDAYLQQQADPDGDVDAAAAWVEEGCMTPPWLEDLGLGLHLNLITIRDGANSFCHVNSNANSTSDPLFAPYATCVATRTTLTMTTTSSRIVFTQPPDSGTAASLAHTDVRVFDYIASTFLFYFWLSIMLVTVLLIAGCTEYFLLRQRASHLKRETKALKRAIKAVVDDKVATILERCMHGVPLEVSEKAVRELEVREARLRRRLDRKRKVLRSARKHLRAFEMVVRGHFGWARLGWRAYFGRLVANAVL